MLGQEEEDSITKQSKVKSAEIQNIDRGSTVENHISETTAHVKVGLIRYPEYLHENVSGPSSQQFLQLTSGTDIPDSSHAVPFFR